MLKFLDAGLINVYSIVAGPSVIMQHVQVLR
jgi:hypothetical protein